MPATINNVGQSPTYGLLTMLKTFRLTWVLPAALLACVGFSARAEPNLNGVTGYINMPDGRIEPDGTFRMGYSFAEPYSSLWSSITFLPRVELYARYTRFMTGQIGAGDPYWQGYGDYKDKEASGKLLLLEEGRNTPSVALGLDDVIGTGLFKSQYLAASKRFGALDTTLGVGEGRISGVFAGGRYAPVSWNGFALAAEYDVNNYKQDLFSVQTGVDQRSKGVGLALEYRHGWLGSQLTYRDNKPGINIYISVPLNQKDFIPKLAEPPADTEIVVRPTLEQWNADPKYRQDLKDRLLKQDFKNIHFNVAGDVAEASLTNTRISLPSRAVGRATRSILLCSPEEVREIRIVYTVRDMPFAAYTFTDADQLQRYFSGLESRKQLAPSVAIDYAMPQRAPSQMQNQTQNDSAQSSPPDESFNSYLDSNDGDIVSLHSENAKLDKIHVAPGVALYFNDPSGALRYDLFVSAAYEKQVKEALFFKTVAQLTLWQDVSAVQEPSNSLLPHVRSDVAEYKKNGSLKLTEAVLNKFYHPVQRVYARSSAGLYEEMFGGAGGQVLYFPEEGPWAFDVSVDALKQRDVEGWFGFRDYSTVTALAAMHYRLPIRGLTATVRAGRFLAKDSGARFELKRRFRSGFEVGAWYTVTNGNDITSPGTPSNPYHDKGIFMTIPLDTMLTKDTQVAPRFSISPWTRDVGQMVVSPGDLYDILEPAYNNMHDEDGLQYFGDLDDSYDQSHDRN